MLHPLLLLLSFLLLLTPAQAYPKLLADEKRCATPLKAGQMIMGAAVVQSKETVVTVTRADGTVLKSGDAYVPGEVLKIGMPAIKGQGIFETMGGDFKTGGACNARRMLPNAQGFADFTAPKDGLDVLVWAGYAPHKGVVTLTQAFLLKGTEGARDLPPGIVPPPAAASTTDVAAATQKQEGGSARFLRG